MGAALPCFVWLVFAPPAAACAPAQWPALLPVPLATLAALYIRSALPCPLQFPTSEWSASCCASTAHHSHLAARLPSPTSALQRCPLRRPRHGPRIQRHFLHQCCRHLDPPGKAGAGPAGAGPAGAKPCTAAQVGIETADPAIFLAFKPRPSVCFTLPPLNAGGHRECRHRHLPALCRPCHAAGWVKLAALSSCCFLTIRTSAQPALCRPRRPLGG